MKQDCHLYIDVFLWKCVVVYNTICMYSNYWMVPWCIVNQRILVKDVCSLVELPNITYIFCTYTWDFSIRRRICIYTITRVVLPSVFVGTYSVPCRNTQYSVYKWRPNLVSREVCNTITGMQNVLYTWHISDRKTIRVLWDAASSILHHTSLYHTGR